MTYTNAHLNITQIGKNAPPSCLCVVGQAHTVVGSRGTGPCARVHFGTGDAVHYYMINRSEINLLVSYRYHHHLATSTESHHNASVRARTAQRQRPHVTLRRHPFGELSRRAHSGSSVAPHGHGALSIVRRFRSMNSELNHYLCFSSRILLFSYYSYFSNCLIKSLSSL